MNYSTCLFVLLALLWSNNLFAYDIAVENVDGVTIYYNYINDGKELEVTYKQEYDYSIENCYNGIVNIPEDVTYDGMTLNVTSISDYAFAHCEGLTSVTIGNNVISIGESAFYQCTSMTSLTIGNSVKTIKEGAFSHCKDLTSILVFCVPEHIEESIFNECSNINDVTFDCEKVVSLFRDTYIRKITMTDKVTSIGMHAFMGCNNLTSVTIPNSVVEIGFSAFNGCKKLTSATIGNNVTNLGQFSFYGTGLTSITIPGSIKTIGNSAFEGCTSLATVTINDGVSNIGSKAFKDCRKLSSSIYFPSSIKDIDGKAFEGVMLDTVFVASQTPPQIREMSDEWSTFYAWYYPRYLYVPTGTVDKYKATIGWKDFWYIEELTPSSIRNFISNDAIEEKRYNINGEIISYPSKGINIIKLKDGTIKKVLIK